MPKRLSLDSEKMSSYVATPKAEQPAVVDDPVKAVGVGLRQSEWDRIRAIAKSLGMKPHELAVWAMRDFLKRYEAGEIKTETRPSLPGQ